MKIESITKDTLISCLRLSIDFICFRRHDEVVLVQAFYEMRPPNDVLMDRIPKSLVRRLSINLVVDSNHKTQSFSPAG
jgi:hypothetical protein